MIEKELGKFKTVYEYFDNNEYNYTTYFPLHFPEDNTLVFTVQYEVKKEETTNHFPKYLHSSK